MCHSVLSGEEQHHPSCVLDLFPFCSMVKNRRKAKKFANRIDPVLSDDVDIHDEKSEKGQEGFCKQDRPFLGDEKHDQAI